jgi:hypothetical protein
MDRIRAMITDLRTRRFMDAYLGWMLAVIVVVIQIVSSFVTHQDKITTLVTATSVMLLGIIALATADIRRDLKETRSVRSWRVFADRSETPSLRDRIESGSSEVYIFGLQLGHVVHELLPLLHRRAGEGYRVNLALLSPVDAAGQQLTWIDQMGMVHSFPNLDQILRTNIERLKQWSSTFDEPRTKNIKIRLYRQIPTASVVIFDPDRSTGYIQVEPILHRLDPSQRPAFWVRRSDSHLLYTNVLSSYLELWRAATPLE